MNDDTQDFYGDNERKEIPEIIGYCVYCKDHVCANEKYLTFEEQLYHKECFLLLFGDGEEQ
jgi:hypothetical protein